MVFLFGSLLYHRSQAHPSPKACQSQDMCQQKKYKNSNQAQRLGDFMRQKWRIYESYASLLIRATDQRRSKKLFGLRSTSARFQRKCFFPLSANLRKIQFMVFPTFVLPGIFEYPNQK